MSYVRTTFRYLRRDFRLSLKAGLSSHARVAMADHLVNLSDLHYIKALAALSNRRAYDYLESGADKQLAHLMGKPIEIAGPLEALP